MDTVSLPGNHENVKNHYVHRCTHTRADSPNSRYSLSTRQSRKRSLTITVNITVNSRSQSQWLGSRRRRPARPRPRPPQRGSGRVGSPDVGTEGRRVGPPPPHLGTEGRRLQVREGRRIRPDRRRPAMRDRREPEGPITTLLGGGVAVNWAVPWLSKTNRAHSPNSRYSLSTRQSLKT